MTFEILGITEAKLATVTTRIERHGDDEKPAVLLGIEIEAGNDILDLLDPSLRPTLYKSADESPTPELEGIEQVLNVLRCNSIERVTIPRKYEGWTLNVDTIGDEDRLTPFGSSKIDKFSVEPRQGGIVTLRMRVGTSDIDAARSGMLAMHVGQPIWITLIAPRPALAESAIDGTQEAFERDHPDAGDLFAAEHDGPGDTDSEGGDTDIEPEDDEDAGPELEDRLDNALKQADAERGENWPLPRDQSAAEAPPQHVTVEKPGRTARGRAATKAALAEGMAAADGAAS